MSQDYAMSRVRDALEKSAGNHLKAQRLVLSWIEKDHSLLFGLVAPHLQSIISHAVGHAARPQQKAMPKRLDHAGETGSFGAAVLSSLKNGREPMNFGQAMPMGHSAPPAASRQHVDAINQLVKAGRAKDAAARDKSKKK